MHRLYIVMPVALLAVGLFTSGCGEQIAAPESDPSTGSEPSQLPSGPSPLAYMDLAVTEIRTTDDCSGRKVYVTVKNLSPQTRMTLVKVQVDWLDRDVEPDISRRYGWATWSNRFGLAPGGSITLEVPFWTTPSIFSPAPDPGDQTLTAKVDWDNRFAEISELNNTRTATVCFGPFECTYCTD